MLRGEHSYDDVDPATQALVRQAWGERIVAAREGLDMRQVLRDAGHSWRVTADEDGQTVIEFADDVD